MLLTQSLAPHERLRAQGLNDLTVFGTQAIVSLAAGAVLYRFGWIAMNLAAAPILLIVIALLTKQRHAFSRSPNQ